MTTPVRMTIRRGETVLHVATLGPDAFEAMRYGVQDGHLLFWFFPGAGPYYVSPDKPLTIEVEEFPA